MCPGCIASTAITVAGAGSPGAILAVCIDKFRRFFESDRSRSVSRTQGRNEYGDKRREMKGTRKRAPDRVVRKLRSTGYQHS